MSHLFLIMHCIYCVLEKGQKDMKTFSQTWRYFKREIRWTEVIIVGKQWLILQNWRCKDEKACLSRRGKSIVGVRAFVRECSLSISITFKWSRKHISNPPAKPSCQFILVLSFIENISYQIKRNKKHSKQRTGYIQQEGRETEKADPKHKRIIPLYSQKLFDHEKPPPVSRWKGNGDREIS